MESITDRRSNKEIISKRMGASSQNNHDTKKKILQGINCEALQFQS